MKNPMMQETKLTNNLQRRPNTVNASFLVLRYLWWALLIFVGLSIATLNAGTVVFHYFWSTATLPLYLLLLLSFVTGCLIGIGLNLVSHIKLHSYNRRLEQKNRVLEVEVTRLRKDFSLEDL